MPNLGAPELLLLGLIAIPVVVVVLVVQGFFRGSRSRGLAPAMAPPGWLADPAQRHQYRYWDGTQWTAAVSDDGVQSTDPL